MRTWRTALLLASGLGFAGAGSASAAHEFPVASLGDIWFQADHAGFRERDGEAVQEFYFRVTNNQVKFVENEGGGWIARVHVKLEFQNADEDKLGEAARSFEFTVPDDSLTTSPERAQILLMREPVDPRTRIVKMQVEDLNSRKRGLLYMVTGKRRNGEAQGSLEPPPFAAAPDSFATSDLQFAWSVEKGEGDFEKNGLNVIPNPARTYGLLQSDVAVYYEVYDLAQGRPGTAYVIEQEVTSPDGRIVHTQTDTVSVQGGEWARVLRFGTEDLPAGAYEVACRIRDFSDTRHAEVHRRFNLVWGRDAWHRSEQDVLDEARVLLTEQDFKKFEKMSLADREVYLADFWDSHNPDPTSPYNALRQEFLQRVGYANLHFTAFGRKGMVTDQGRIYIRFGVPDEVSSVLIPTVDSQLTNLVSGLEDVEPGIQTLESPDAVDTRPYEIWEYTQQGRPLFPSREFGTSRTGLRFVFVDETGTGHYVLRYTSDFVDF